MQNFPPGHPLHGGRMATTHISLGGPPPGSPGTTGTHHIDGSVCTYATQGACTHPTHLTGMAPVGGPPPGSVRCDCCDQIRSSLPYNHTGSNPPHLSYSYCQECYDAGCGGPGDCELDYDEDELGDCVVCKQHRPIAADGTGGIWCVDCHEAYSKYLKTHPIPFKDKFTPVYRGEQKPLAHMPAYMYPPAEWHTIDFKPEYILNPASAPPPTKKRTFIMNQPTPPQAPAGQPAPYSHADPSVNQAPPQRQESTEEMVRRLIAEQSGGQPQQGPTTEVTIDAMLESIDPRDSDTALKLFHWLRDNHRLQKVATLDQGGYLFLYAEPEGASKQGYVAGGTQGDQVVDNALEQAKAQGGKPTRGLCKKCFSPIQQIGDAKPELEIPRNDGSTPSECSAGGDHEFA